MKKCLTFKDIKDHYDWINFSGTNLDNEKYLTNRDVLTIFSNNDFYIAPGEKDRVITDYPPGNKHVINFQKNYGGFTQVILSTKQIGINEDASHYFSIAGDNYTWYDEQYPVMINGGSVHFGDLVYVYKVEDNFSGPEVNRPDPGYPGINDPLQGDPGLGKPRPGLGHGPIMGPGHNLPGRKKVTAIRAGSFNWSKEASITVTIN